MKNVILLSLLILSGYTHLFGQSHAIKFGKIDHADLAMSIYKKDSGASAVVMADFGSVSFNYRGAGLSFDFERHVRIKILKKTGLKHADVEIPLYRKGEKVGGSIKGVTYNLEYGNIVEAKLDKNQIFTQELNDYYDLVKFSMPNVKEGSVIEYKYKVNSEYFFSLVTWEFQRDIPTIWSEFTARIPDFLHYKTLMGGYIPLTAMNTSTSMDNNKIRVNNYMWAIEHAPALQEEKFITTMSDYTSKIEFELQTINIPGQVFERISHTWEKLNDDLNKSEHFGRQIGKGKYLAELVAGITAQASTPLEKAQMISQYVRQHIQYNGNKRLYTSAQLKKILEEKKGNSADINLLLVSMLQQAGLEANPVILSTRENGWVNSTPLLQDFNYVVAHVKIEDKTLLLDGTDPDLPFDILPFYCLNQKGRLISPQHTEWVTLSNQEKLSASITGTFKLNPDGSLNGELKSIKNGYLASETRAKIKAEGEQQYLNALRGKHADWVINSYQYTHLDEVNQDLEEMFDLNLITAATPAADKIYLQSMLTGAEKENPFKLEKREYPVDFGCPVEERYMFKIELPEGYTVEEMPQQALISLPDQGGNFRYTISMAGNSVFIISTLKIEKPIFYAEEYPNLRYFYDLIVAKHAEQIVLKKIP